MKTRGPPAKDYINGSLFDGNGRWRLTVSSFIRSASL
jgi:hypothetical protein